MTAYDEAYEESVHNVALAYADEVDRDGSDIDIESPLLASIASDIGDIEACVAHSLELADDEDAGIYALAAEADGSIADAMEEMLADVVAEAEAILAARAEPYRFAGEISNWGVPSDEYILV